MRIVLVPLFFALLPFAAHAQQPVEAFSKCVAENTTGRDRKDLAKWMFVAMGAHPEMRAIASLPPSAAEDASRAFGRMFTKLVTETCPKEARAAVSAVGSSAIQAAFTVLGQLAMQELMTDPDVAAGMSLVDKYIDSEKVQATLGSK
jgi:hypothetical protein